MLPPPPPPPAFADTAFVWPLHYFGILFDDDAKVGKVGRTTSLTSPAFELKQPPGDGAGSDEPPLQFCLQARARRACPQGMLRVYVRLAAVVDDDEDEEEVSRRQAAIRGRYDLWAFYQPEDMDQLAGLSVEAEDGFLNRKLSRVWRRQRPCLTHDDDDVDDEVNDDEVFIGWAGSCTEYLSRYVLVKIRAFPKPPTLAPTTALVLARELTPAAADVRQASIERIIRLVYDQWLENLSVQLKARMVGMNDDYRHQAAQKRRKQLLAPAEGPAFGRGHEDDEGENATSSSSPLLQSPAPGRPANTPARILPADMAQKIFHKLCDIVYARMKEQQLQLGDRINQTHPAAVVGSNKVRVTTL